MKDMLKNNFSMLAKNLNYKRESPRDKRLLIDFVINRDEKKYCVFVTERINKDYLNNLLFKETIKHCKSQGLKFVIIALHQENLFDYTMDLEQGDSLDFKIILYDRVKSLNRDVINCLMKTNNEIKDVFSLKLTNK